MKKLFTFLTFFILFSSYAAGPNKPTPPNETKIYYHIHQASLWAKLYYTDKNIHAPLEMGIHLGNVKFGEERLVDSQFYSEFTFFYNLIHDFSNSSLGEIEKLRKEMELKAKKHKILLPTSWKAEFHFLQ